MLFWQNARPFCSWFFLKRIRHIHTCSDGCFAFRQRFGSFSAALAALLRPLFFTNKHMKGECFFRKNVKKQKIKEEFVSEFTKNSIKNIHPSVPILRISQQMRIIEKCWQQQQQKLLLVTHAFLSNTEWTAHEFVDMAQNFPRYARTEIVFAFSNKKVKFIHIWILLTFYGMAVMEQVLEFHNLIIMAKKRTLMNKVFFILFDII